MLTLGATSAFVWISPSSTVNQALTTAAKTVLKTDTLAEERAAWESEKSDLLSEIDVLESSIEVAKDNLKETNAKSAALQQELWSIEGTLKALQAGGAKDSVASTPPVSSTPSSPSTPASGGTVITAPSKAEIINPASTYLGLYTEQAPFNWATYDSASTKLGSNPNVVGYFGGWDEDFRANAVTRSWEKETLPILTWESRPIGSANDQIDEPDYTLPAIIGDPEAGVPGTFDDYLHQYAKDIVDTGLPLGIRLDHEMNGVWYPWAETDGQGNSINSNRVGDFVTMWQHVHDIFAEEGANDLVVWIWAPNIINNLPATHQSSDFLDGLYPGDDYVDWVGLSGYLRPPYIAENDFTFSYTFDSSLAELRRITNKPIFLTEIGASETGGHKAEWVSSLFESLAKPENDDIIGISWFNLAVTTYVEGERATNDWRIDSRADSLAAFIEGLARPDSDFDLTAR
ncbi:glycosyl hydrolase [Salinibacterium sp. NK8237]|uniref:glycoside hydrolase family 26 protein n=1 Tax=Salinibacterium sp. NK8237 TaxID=2792038 RepID=UPI0027DE3C28|nr:glycosyl hydrolase [Salinibacterium sp. NK8237]